MLWTMLGIVMMGGYGCKEVLLAEQLHNVPKAMWQASTTDSFRFTISDTMASYKVGIVLRHTNQYPYRNVWVRVGLKQPGDDSLRMQDFNLPLATADSWLGIGMGDIYEVRPALFEQGVSFPKSGELLFTLQHIMRQDPLPGVMQVGIRVEPQ